MVIELQSFIWTLNTMLNAASIKFHLNLLMWFNDQLYQGTLIPIGQVLSCHAGVREAGLCLLQHESPDRNTF